MIKPQPPGLTHLILTIGFSISAATAAFAQATPPLETEPASGSDPITLSPFTVNSEKDTGYQATDSLAGTRLRTPLKNIAASISVVTADFLADTGANNLADLLVYTTGTEVSGVGGNFGGFTPSAAGSDFFLARRDINPQTRVRGLAAADLTRNFFGSGIPFDSYNSESVTINRGANSILFGLGSPAGIIDTTTLHNRFRDAGKVELRFDSNSSHRESIDLERVLVKDQLSLRIAALNDKGSYEQDPSYRDQKRIYGALEYKPFKNTTVRINAEKGKIDQSLPRIDPPADYLTPWYTFGKLARTTNVVVGPNLTIGSFAGDPTGNPVANYDRYHNIDGPAGSWFYGPGVLYGSPSSGSPTDSFVAFADSPAIGSNPALQYRFYAPRGVQDSLQSTLQDPLAPFLVTQQITDRSVFDYRKHRLDGPNSGTFAKFNALNVAVEQLFLEGHAGLEYVYDWQDRATDVYEAENAQRANWIMVDENAFTSDGRVNPNFGRPFTSSGGMSSRVLDNSQNSRLTGFLRHNFAEGNSGLLGKILGEHTLTGFYQTSTTNAFSLSGLYAAFDPSFVNGNGSSALGDRSISSVVYLGPSLINTSSPVGSHISAITAALSLPTSLSSWTLNKANNYVWTKTPTLVHTYPDFDYLTTNVGATRNEVRSYGGVWQADLWEDVLVATLGWRDDKVTNFTGDTTGTNPATGAQYTKRPTVIQRLSVENRLFSQGYALHVPSRWTQKLPGQLDFSLYANRSENFQITGFRQDALGKGIDPQAGATKEYGVGVSAFSGKLNFRVARYDTDQNNQTDNSATSTVVQIGEIERRIQSTNTPAALAAAGYVGFNIGTPSALYNQFLKTFAMRVDAVSDAGYNLLLATTPIGLAQTTSTKSKGYEFELTYNPLPNWRLTLNASREEASRGDIDPLIAALIADRQPYWNLPGVKDLIASPSWTTSTYAQSLILNPYALRVMQTGTPAAELRKWHFNAVTNYEFSRNSLLKGWAVGGAGRWIDKIVLGYPVITDPKLGLVSDVSHPFMGDSEYTFDSWLSYQRPIWNKKIGWKLQLNVKNVLNDNRLIPVRANPIKIGDLRNYTVGAYRIGESRTFELTSTFTF